MGMRSARAFTLVEILIVVVILGVLSAVVVPQFSSASDEAAAAATRDQLVKIRNAIAVYHVRNGSKYPLIQEGGGQDTVWAGLMGGGDYLRVRPRNNWIAPANADVIAYGVGPDVGYQTAHGWIYNPGTGDIWAGSFDMDDKPYPRP